MVDLPAGRQARLSMFFVYILRLGDGSFYKGQTSNLEIRLQEHNQGQCASTKNKLPHELVHVELCVSRSQAGTMEKFFKSGYGREIIREIVKE